MKLVYALLTSLALSSAPAATASSAVSASASASTSTAAASMQASAPLKNSLPEATQAWLKQSADEAQKRCYEYMHDDATEYTSCLNALLAAVKGKGSKAQQQRLGISYFAWVGANNSARLSLPGSEAAAQFYLPKFRQLQSQLKISDQDLCPSIAGDCKARVAQYLQMEKELQEMKEQAKRTAKGKHQTSSKDK